MSGSAQPQLPIRDMKLAEIPIPEISIQRRIASILSAYDDLIEVNRRRIVVLEEMARRLFDEWFVNFRFPGHEVCELVETENGRLPNEWHWAPLEDFLVLQRGFDLPTQTREPGDVTLVSASGISGTHSIARVQAPGIVTGRSGTIGGVYLIHEDFWPLNTTLYVKEFKRATPSYALHLLRNLDLKSRAVGAAVPSLNRNHIHGILLPCPPHALVNRFDEYAWTLLKSVHGLDRSQTALAASRDLLLPRLISGELSVATAERELDAAA
jgi:type I restriction enzyme S subunit